MYHAVRSLTTLGLLTAGLLTTTLANGQKNFPTAPGVTGSAEGLVRETSDPGQEAYPKVSPDGKSLLYNALETTSSAVMDPSGRLSIKTSKKYKIVKKLIGVPTTNPLGTDAAYPTWLPDGSGVIYAYIKPDKPVIVRSNINGIGLNYISPAAMGEDDAEPIVMKDGKTIIFSTVIGPDRMICTMDIKGNNYSVITPGGHVALDPSSADKIIYNQVVGKTVQIFTLNLKTGEKTQLTSGDYNNRDGAFSRDGKFLAFVSNRENPKKTIHHLYMMRVDGSDLVQITQGFTNEIDPCFGPDGTIYFASNAEKNYNIWKVKPKF